MVKRAVERPARVRGYRGETPVLARQPEARSGLIRRGNVEAWQTEERCGHARQTNEQSAWLGHGATSPDRGPIAGRTLARRADKYRYPGATLIPCSIALR